MNTRSHTQWTDIGRISHLQRQASVSMHSSGPQYFPSSHHEALKAKRSWFWNSLDGFSTSQSLDWPKAYRRVFGPGVHVSMSSFFRLVPKESKLPRYIFLSTRPSSMIVSPKEAAYKNNQVMKLEYKLVLGDCQLGEVSLWWWLPRLTSPRIWMISRLWRGSKFP